MALDPVFWDIVELPENLRRPLSFRSNGAWTCRTPPWAGEDVSENDFDPDRLAIEILSRSNRQVAALGTLSLDAFLTFVLHAPHGFPDAYFATEFTTLALLGRYDQAKSMCKAARARGDRGGFSVGRRSFIDLAEAWLVRTEQTSHS